MLENITKLVKNYSAIIATAIICLVSSFIIAVSAQLSIPLPDGVPMTLQTFSVALIGYCLPGKYRIKSILTYLFLGILGIPVFANGTFGIATILSITGGFLFGFIFLIYFCGKATSSKSFINKLILSIIGLFACHFFGVLQYSTLTGLNLWESFLLISFPFLLKDFLSVIFAFITSKEISFIKNKLQ